MEVNYIALAVPAFFLLIGVELLVARLQRASYYRFDDAITDLSCGVGQQVVGLFVKGALVAAYAFVYDRFALLRSPTDSAAPWIIAFVGVDLCYYVWHRLSHEVAFM